MGRKSRSSKRRTLPAQHAAERGADAAETEQIPGADSSAAAHSAPESLAGSRRARRRLWGAIFAAVTAIVIPVATFVYANADSHLVMSTEKSSHKPEIRGTTVSEGSITAMTAIYASFSNTGFRSDYIDRVEVRSINYDPTLSSEPRFIDRRPIAWREQKELRFEVLVTFALNSSAWHDFVVTFYDSRGRQVGQTPVTTRIGEPGDIAPKVKQMKPVGAGVWESATTAPPPRANSIPTLVAASIAGPAPQAYHVSDRRFFAWVLTPAGKVVAQSNPQGVRVKSGQINLEFQILTPVNRTMSLQAVVWTEPRPDPADHLTLTGTLVWSDGIRTETEVTLEPLADKATSK